MSPWLLTTNSAQLCSFETQYPLFSYKSASQFSSMAVKFSWMTAELAQGIPTPLSPLFKYLISLWFGLHFWKYLKFFLMPRTNQLWSSYTFLSTMWPPPPPPWPTLQQNDYLTSFDFVSVIPSRPEFLENLKYLLKLIKWYLNICCKRTIRIFFVLEWISNDCKCFSSVTSLQTCSRHQLIWFPLFFSLLQRETLWLISL